jgi:hypothetical protein
MHVKRNKIFSQLRNAAIRIERGMQALSAFNFKPDLAEPWIA